jgi:arylsulfatase B
MKRFAVLFLLLALAVGAAADGKPNVLLVVVDDLGYGELGCQGNAQIPTPQIDSIAANGVRFTDGYVSGPVCCPSRAGFITGRYQTRFGHEHNAIGLQNLDPAVGLPLSQKTIADLMKAQGYATGLVGKWHLGASERYHPMKRGFDEFYGFLNEGHFYVDPPYEGVLSWFRVKSLPGGEAGRRMRKGNYVFSTHMGNTEPMYDRENPLMRGYNKLGPERDFLTDALTREAISFVNRHVDEPWFLYLSYNVPHSPLQTKFEDAERMKEIEDIHRRIFAGMMVNLDDNVGRLLRVLDYHKLTEETLIIFFSDNGAPTRELTSSNAPLRGEKGRVYEGGLRVPFLIQWKGNVPAGKVYRNPVIALDALPTSLAAIGAEIPDNLDGVNLLPYLRGETTGVPHDSLYWRYGNRTALRQGKWKILSNPGYGETTARFELYDLAADIGEETDLAAEQPVVFKKLKAELDRMNGEMVPALWRSKGSGAKVNWPLDLLE